MNKKLNILLLLCIAININATTDPSFTSPTKTTPSKASPINDTLYTELTKDVIILSSIKETNSLKFLPASVSIFSQKNLNDFQISSVKDLSGMVPNYYATKYGARMTAPIYIRGIGARSGNQTVSMYVDNIPYFNTTSFDTELFDIQRIEVLRGTQGTLYGRNAMGGIVNVYTYNPLDYQGTRLKIGGGSYGFFQAEGSVYKKLNDTNGISVAGYYKRNDGRILNHTTGNKIDHESNFGFRLRYATNILPNLQMNYIGNYDDLKQGAFPYEDLETGRVDHNIDGFYNRKLQTNGLTFKYSIDGVEFNSITSYQHLSDDMGMDNDFTSKEYFQINQRQNQNSVSQEFTAKSLSSSNYQWSNGISGFYDHLKTNAPVYMLQDGINEHLIGSLLPNIQSVFPNATIDINRDMLNLNSNFKNNSHGFAVFHQSTLNNIANVSGLSGTVGLRLDYERTKLHYDSRLDDDVEMSIKLNPMIPPQKFELDTIVRGVTTDYYLELLPRFVLKYEYSDVKHVYISTSKGYKSGGHNIQGFADILQNAIMAKGGRGVVEQDIDEIITYKPEYSWNFELGGQMGYFDNSFQLNYSLYYMKVDDVQLTQFMASMGGRYVTNGGKAESKGVELSMKFRPCNGFFMYASYGLADAKFRKHNSSILQYNPETGNSEEVEVSYAGNRIPFAPTATYSLGASFDIDLTHKNLHFDGLAFDVHYTGFGKVYWNESNTLHQNFYGTLGAKAQITKKYATLELWGKNILNRKYNTFVFDSGSKSDLKYYGQRGLPAEFGVALKLAF